MPFDNRPDPLAVTVLTHKPNFEYPENADLWAYAADLYGTFNPDPGPWERWETLNIGPNPDLPLELEGDDNASSVHGFRKRWEKEDSKFTLSDYFKRVTFYLNPFPYYTLVGGSLALPGGKAQEFVWKVPGFRYVSDTESLRRSIIADEYGAAAFEGGDIKNGPVTDPRLRDWADNETNLRIANEAAETLAMGCDYLMIAPGHKDYAAQTKAFQSLALAEGRRAVARLVAGTQDIEKTLKEAHAHGSKTGEWMTPEQIIAAVKDFSRNFEKAAAAADQVQLWNTDGDEPVLIARKTGPGEKLEWMKDVETDPQLQGKLYNLYYKFYEQQYYNPRGNNLKEIDARRALHELFGPRKPEPGI